MSGPNAIIDQTIAVYLESPAMAFMAWRNIEPTNPLTKKNPLLDWDIPLVAWTKIPKNPWTFHDIPLMIPTWFIIG